MRREPWEPFPRTDAVRPSEPGHAPDGQGELRRESRLDRGSRVNGTRITWTFAHASANAPHRSGLMDPAFPSVRSNPREWGVLTCLVRIGVQAGTARLVIQMDTLVHVCHQGLRCRASARCVSRRKELGVNPSTRS